MSDYKVDVTLTLKDNFTQPLNNAMKIMNQFSESIKVLDEVSKKLNTRLNTMGKRLEEVNNAAQRMASSINSATGSANNLTGAARQASIAMQTTSSSAAQVGNSIQTAGSRMTQLRLAITNITNSTNPLKTAFSELRSALSQFSSSGSSSFDKVREKADQFYQKIVEAYRSRGLLAAIGTEVSGVVAPAFDVAKRASESFTTGIGKVKTAMSNLKTAAHNIKDAFMKCFSEGILAPFYNKLRQIINLNTAINFAKSSFQSYAELEQSKANLRIINEDTDTNKYESDVLKSAHESGMTLKDAYDVASYVMLSGFTPDEVFAKGANGQSILDMYLKGVRIGTATGTADKKETADAISDVMLSFWGEKGSKDINNLQKTMDATFTAQSIWNMNSTQFFDALKKNAATMSGAGFSLDQTLALTGQLASSRKGSEAGNSFRAMITRLTSGNKNVMDALAKLGISESVYRSQFDKNGQFKDGMGFFKMIFQNMDKLSGYDQQQVMAALSGSYRKEDFSLLKRAFLDGSLEDKYKQLQERQQGGTDRQYEEANSTPYAKLEQIQSAWNDGVKVMFGQGLFEGIAEGLGGTLDDIMALFNSSEGMEAIKDFAKGIGQNIGEALSWMWQHKEEIWECVKALGELYLVFQGLTTIGNVAGLFSSIGTAMSLIGPEGMLIVAVIGLITGAIVLLWQNSQEFRDGCSEAWKIIQESIKNAWDKIKEPLGKIKDDLKKLAKTVGPMAGDFVKLAASIGGDLLKVLSEVLFLRLEMLHKALETIQWVAEKVASAFEKMKEGIKWFSTDEGIAATKEYNSIKTGGASGGLDSVTPHNANGTDFWRGGLTYVNEGYRGELINLPSGTQIIPNDLSRRIIDRNAAAMRGTSGGSAYVINVNNPVVRDELDIDKIGQQLANRLELYRLKMA